MAGQRISVAPTKIYLHEGKNERRAAKTEGKKQTLETETKVRAKKAKATYIWEEPLREGACAVQPKPAQKRK